ncbi:type IIL restriction-modification enzyme MmeI [Nesterenkonia suensis]
MAVIVVPFFEREVESFLEGSHGGRHVFVSDALTGVPYTTLPDATTMDPALIKAHSKLDAIVDRAFGADHTCQSEKERQEILFARYAEMTADK